MGYGLSAYQLRANIYKRPPSHQGVDWCHLLFLVVFPSLVLPQSDTHSLGGEFCNLTAMFQFSFPRFFFLRKTLLISAEDTMWIIKKKTLYTTERCEIFSILCLARLPVSGHRALFLDSTSHKHRKCFFAFVFGVFN